jgi:uridylate kinase
MTAQVLKYRRILLKYSGEVLQGSTSFGVEPLALDYVVGRIKQLQEMGVEVAIVLGGGNFFRGKNLLSAGFDQAKSDQMGMLATIMNAIALQHALTADGTRSTVYSAIPMPGFVQSYEIELVRQALTAGEVVICAGGTGLPFFTTDTAACLRAIELQADIVLKATKVDGVYSKDPTLHSDAIRYDNISYDEAIEKKLAVMDTTAICLCQEHQLPIQVFNMHNENALKEIVLGERIGTIVGAKHVARA